MVGSLAAAFRRGIPASTTVAEDDEEVERALASVLGYARTAQPTLAIDGEELAQELGRRLAFDGRSITCEAISACAAGDVAVAIGCARHDLAAIQVLETYLQRAVKRAARGRRASADHCSEVLQRLRHLLLVDEPGRVAAARSFAGRGSLLAYASVAAARELVRILKHEGRHVSTPPELMASLLPFHVDPVVDALRERYRDDVAAAFSEAFGLLEPDSRQILSLRLQGMSHADLARVYAISKATAHRRVVEAQTELADRVKDALSARLGIPRDGVASIVRMVRSQIALSLG